MKDLLIVDLRVPMSISFKDETNVGSLPSYLNCGNDVSILLNNKSKGTRYFFCEFVKCIFRKKTTINKLKIYITQEQFELLDLSDNFTSTHFIENIDENFLILIEKKNII